MAKSKYSFAPNPTLGISPEGVLLEFEGDLKSDFGFAYERFLSFKKDHHSHDRFVFCAARGATVFRVTELKTSRTFVNSRDLTVFKPPNAVHSLKSDQTIYENIVFLPTVSRLRSTFVERNYPKADWHTLTSGIREVRRSPWFDSLVERYFNRRVFAAADTTTLRVLEEEILKEMLSLILSPVELPIKNRPNSASAPLTDTVRRVVELLELSLFSELHLDEVSKRAGLSRASLMRAFNRELKISPMAYVRRRRLEEAKRLLSKNVHSITEVSYLVGYENTSAFCRAYKAHFGSPPRSDRES